MTTILALAKGDEIILCGDGQATAGSLVVKNNSRKIRQLGNKNIYTGFAGSVVDAFALQELFEEKVNENSGNFMNAVMRMALEWRQGKRYKNLEATLVATDGKQIYAIDGRGGLTEPERNVLAVGSGSILAQCSAIALLEKTNLPLREIAEYAMSVAGDLDVHSNHNVIFKHFKDGVLIYDSEKQGKGA